MIGLVAESGAMGQFITQLMGFAILVFVIWWFAWKHLVNIFKNRREQIAAKVEESEKGAAESKEEIEKFGDQLAHIDRDAEKRLDAARKEGRAGRDDLLAQARIASQRIQERAKREITLERDKALMILREDSIRLTLAAAEGLVDRTMDDSTHNAMVQKYIQDLDKVTHE